MDTPDEAALERGRLLFAQPCVFRFAAGSHASLPPQSLPEVAFAGRSNVGKSSLLNALTGQTKLARVSQTPGRTRELNFFALGSHLMLVDLPGYGFAKVSKTQAAQWGAVIEDYLRGRQSLGRVCLLIDARHGLKPSDEAIMTLLDRAAQSFLVVLTKSDALTADDLAARVTETAAKAARHPAAYPDIIATSARTGLGIADLRAHLALLVPREAFGYKPAASQEGGS